MSKSIFRELLDKEQSLALGCTEPMMFALGGAICHKYAPGEVKRVHMEGCGLMVTGVQAVGIPKTHGKTGAFLSAAVGIIAGDVDACKEVLHNVTDADVAKAEELIKKADFSLSMDNSSGKLVYMKMTLTTIDGHTATVIFEDEHHNAAYIEADGKVIKDERLPAGKMLVPYDDIDWNEFTIEGIWNWCKTCDVSELETARKSVEANTKLAKDGIDNPRGIQTARVLKQNIEKGFVADDELMHVLIWSTAGADARMGGSDYPAMVSTASGNQGAMVHMAPWSAAQYRGASEEEGLRAVAFASLINTWLKYRSREFVYMPPTCSCAGTSAPAGACGVAFLHGFTPQQINDMLCTCLTVMNGVVCDGAKPTCAYRMFVSMFGCLEAMMMVEAGIRTGSNEGFVHDQADVTVDNIYRLQKNVLWNKVDPILWDIMQEQKDIH